MQGIKQARRELDFSRQLEEKGGWYHSFELPDGTVIQGHQSVDHLRQRYANFPIPAELGGKRVLDVGAWDGWFSFQAERHGADVTAIDCVEIPNFLQMQRVLSSRVDYRILDFFDLPKECFAPFDYVFFLGVLYHLKHPLLALEIVCGLTKDIAIVDSFVTNGATWRESKEEIPTLEFYETDELGGHQDNWFGPTVGCLLALCRAAGFVRMEVLETHGFNVAVACYRHHPPVPANPRSDPPQLAGVRHGWNGGINFYSSREEYLAWWFAGLPEGTTREDLLLEVGGYGVPTIFLKEVSPGIWQANSRLAPGLSPGWHEARARLRDSAFSNSDEIAVDIPAHAELLSLQGVRDGLRWTENEIALSPNETFASCWIGGLPENCDTNNIRIYLDGVRLEIVFVGEKDSDGVRQVNTKLPRSTKPGNSEFTVKFGNAGAGPHAVRIR